MTINYTNTLDDVKKKHFNYYTQFHLIKNLLTSASISIFFSYLIIPLSFGYSLIALCAISIFILYQFILFIWRYWLPLRKALKDQPKTLISQNLTILEDGLKHIGKEENMYLWTSIKFTYTYVNFFIIGLVSDEILLIPYKGQKTDHLTNFIGLIKEKTPLPIKQENTIPILNNLAVFTSFIPFIGLLAVTGFYLSGNISFKRKNSIRLIGLGLIFNIATVAYFIITTS